MTVRDLPAVDALADQLAATGLPRIMLIETARRAIDTARAVLLDGGDADAVALARQEAARIARRRPQRVINATGVLLHTNLGRAPLHPPAARRAAEAATGYAALELDLATGRRGGRAAYTHDLVARLTGAEAALVVNNNAGALFLALAALGSGGRVVVSRGELIEIGGSFRLPELMLAAGVRLVEVGTTNRTHADDYRRALGPRTGLLLKVHRSNFELRGYVAEVGVQELAGIARAHAVPLLEDLGSGTLLDLRAWGLPEACWAPGRLRLGADLVCFSGDKLLGGPQAGILLGRSESLDALRRDPLARAVRLDKLAIAALDATLRLLLDEQPERSLPVLRALTETAPAVEGRARRLAERLAAAAGTRLAIRVEPTRAPVGGGSLPGFEIDSWAVALRPPDGPDALARRLRRAAVPVLVRVREDAVLLDARTLLPDDEEALEASLGAALADAAD